MPEGIHATDDCALQTLKWQCIFALSSAGKGHSYAMEVGLYAICLRID